MGDGWFLIGPCWLMPWTCAISTKLFATVIFCDSVLHFLPRFYGMVRAALHSSCIFFHIGVFWWGQFWSVCPRMSLSGNCGALLPRIKIWILCTGWSATKFGSRTLLLWQKTFCVLSDSGNLIRGGSFNKSHSLIRVSCALLRHWT